MIHNLEAIEFDEDRFAAIFGVSARHLRRVFKQEIGKTPKQIAIENRLNLARNLVIETALPMNDIALAAGFQSIRRFNDAFRDRFRRAPSALRRKNLNENSLLIVHVPYRPPFDFEGLLQFYRVHSIGNLEEFDQQRLIRYIKLQDHEGLIAITNESERHALKVEIDFPNVGAIHTILAKVRRMFDLDSDPLLIANTFDADPKLAKLFKKYPGLRVPTGWDPFETAIATILGQLVSMQFGRQLVSDLIDNYGEPFLTRPEIKSFPSPHVLANSDLNKIKTTGRRKATIREFSRQVASGELSLESTQNVEDFRAQLLRIKGVGEWTADYMALKVLGHADSFPATDLILARALAIHSRESIDKLSPWRGYGAALLWSEYAGKLNKNPSTKNRRSNS